MESTVLHPKWTFNSLSPVTTKYIQWCGFFFTRTWWLKICVKEMLWETKDLSWVFFILCFLLSSYASKNIIRTNVNIYFRSIFVDFYFHFRFQIKYLLERERTKMLKLKIKNFTPKSPNNFKSEALSKHTDENQTPCLTNWHLTVVYLNY